MKIISKFFIIFFLLIFPYFFVLAQTTPITGTPAPGGSGGSNGTVKLDNPIPDVTPETLIGRGINAVLGFTGTIALVMFIWGGFTMMFSAGASDKIKKGRDILIWASIGLAVIFSAYGLVQFVLSSIAGT